jgi:dCTP deaminase
MYLSDQDIRNMLLSGKLIKSWSEGEEGAAPEVLEEAIQPASLDLRLDDNVLIVHRHENHFRKVEKDRDGYFVFKPGPFYLGSTMEVVKIPDTLLARVDGRSTIGRAGMRVHSTAGFIDPGFEGHITLEIDVLREVKLKPGTRICQISFAVLHTPALRPYGYEGRGSAYQGQRGPTPGKLGPFVKGE